MWQLCLVTISKFLRDPEVVSWTPPLIYLATLSVLIWQAKSQRDAVRLQTQAIQGSEATRIHQVLLSILMEYRSAEMLLAIRTLWDFSRAHKDDFVDLYEAIQKRDSEAVAALPPAVSRVLCKRLSVG
ncbi:MAG: hypothetical protein WBL61_08920 [Bryobacteraceae bacterium]